jgi:hypothetical protein
VTKEDDRDNLLWFFTTFMDIAAILGFIGIVGFLAWVIYMLFW